MSKYPQNIEGSHNQRFPVGTRFMSGGKNKHENEVLNFLTTRNLAGNIVRTEYLVFHVFCGQRMTELTCGTTIARGLLPEYLHLLEVT